MGRVLKITKADNWFKTFQIQKACTSIKLSNNLSQISAELIFTIPRPTFSGSFIPVNLEIGDIVNFEVDNHSIFIGKIIDIDLKGKAEQVKVTCYDYTWWICKGNVTKNFNDITVRQALGEVYFEVGARFSFDAELGENGNIILNNYLVKDKPASKVLNAIYNEVTKRTGLYYYLHQDEKGFCTITELDKYYSNLTIQAPTNKNAANGNLIDFEIIESMENMVTSVAIYTADGRRAEQNGQDFEANIGENIITLDNFEQTRYGYIQESITMDEDGDIAKARMEAMQILNEKAKPTEILSVTCIGDINYKVGYGVLVKIPSTAYYDKFMYITSSEWTWNKDGTFISKLELSPSKHKTSDTFESLDAILDAAESSNISSGSDSSGGSDSSDLWSRIETELKRYLGSPYVWGGKTPSGFDCSGYVAYVFNQFSNELNITSTSRKLTSYTVTMMNEGKNVTKEFPNNLRPGDIIFPHANHVVVYLGNNKVIHAPRTGDVIKISDIYFDTPTRVIRIIPESAGSSASSASNASSSSGTYSSKLVEFTKSWEGYRSTVYADIYGTKTIGYGTTGMANPAAIKQGTCTKEQATKWLTDEMDNIAKQVLAASKKKGVTLNQFALDCLCDLSYQWGWPTILNNNKNNIFSSLCGGDTNAAKTGIKKLGYARRDNARCDMLGGTYTLNS